MRISLTQFLASQTALVFFLTNCVFTGTSYSASIWQDRKKNIQVASVPTSSAFLLPTAVVPRPSFLPKVSRRFGTFRRVAPSSKKQSKATIYLIQDVHLNPEAQSHMGQAVQSLVEREGIRLIGLEGAFDSFDLEPYKNHPDKNVTARVADYLMEQKEISGVVYQSIKSGFDGVKLIGVDDPFHYKANVGAYLKSLKVKEKVKRSLDIRKKETDRLKEKHLNRRLEKVDRIIEQYRKGDMALGAMLSFLSAYVASPSKDIKTFLKAWQIEKKLNLKEVERQRSVILEKLISKSHSSEQAQFVHQSVLFRTGEISQGEFYAFFKMQLAKKGIELKKDSALFKYIQYTQLAESVDAQKLLSAVHSFEQQAYSQAIETKQEENIINQSTLSYFTQKLIDFSLTPHEWNRYQDLKTNSTDDSLKVFESFYEHALARNQTLANRLTEQMDSLGETKAILVVGGFHAPGLATLFKEKNMVTIPFTPRLTKVDLDSGTHYLSVFSQEKTPLQKLSQGEKLFVATSPYPNKVKVAGLFAAHNPSQAQSIFDRFLPFKVWVNLIYRKDGSVIFSVSRQNIGRLFFAVRMSAKKIGAVTVLPFRAPGLVVQSLWSFLIPLLKDFGWKDKDIVKLGGIEAFIFFSFVSIPFFVLTLFEVNLFLRLIISTLYGASIYYMAHKDNVVGEEGTLISETPQKPKPNEIFVITLIGTILSLGFSVILALGLYDTWQGLGFILSLVMVQSVFDSLARPRFGLAPAFVPVLVHDPLKLESLRPVGLDEFGIEVRDLNAELEASADPKSSADLHSLEFKLDEKYGGPERVDETKEIGGRRPLISLRARRLKNDASGWAMSSSRGYIPTVNEYWRQFGLKLRSEVNIDDLREVDFFSEDPKKGLGKFFSKYGQKFDEEVASALKRIREEFRDKLDRKVPQRVYRMVEIDERLIPFVSRNADGNQVWAMPKRRDYMELLLIHYGYAHLIDQIALDEDKEEESEFFRSKLPYPVLDVNEYPIKRIDWLEILGVPGIGLPEVYLLENKKKVRVFVRRQKDGSLVWARQYEKPSTDRFNSDNHLALGSAQFENWFNTIVGDQHDEVVPEQKRELSQEYESLLEDLLPTLYKRASSGEVRIILNGVTVIFYKGKGRGSSSGEWFMEKTLDNLRAITSGRAKVVPLTYNLFKNTRKYRRVFNMEEDWKGISMVKIKDNEIPITLSYFLENFEGPKDVIRQRFDQLMAELDEDVDKKFYAQKRVRIRGSVEEMLFYLHEDQSGDPAWVMAGTDQDKKDLGTIMALKNKQPFNSNQSNKSPLYELLPVDKEILFNVEDMSRYINLSETEEREINKFLKENDPVESYQKGVFQIEGHEKKLRFQSSEEPIVKAIELRLLNRKPVWAIKGTNIDSSGYGIPDGHLNPDVMEVASINPRLEVPLTFDGLFGYLEELTAEDKPDFLNKAEFKKNLNTLVVRAHSRLRLKNKNERFFLESTAFKHAAEPVRLFFDQRYEGDLRVWVMEKSPFALRMLINEFGTSEETLVLSLLENLLEQKTPTLYREAFKKPADDSISLSELLKKAGNSKKYLEDLEALLRKNFRSEKRKEKFEASMMRLPGTSIYVRVIYEKSDEPKIFQEYLDDVIQAYQLIPKVEEDETYELMPADKEILFDVDEMERYLRLTEQEKEAINQFLKEHDPLEAYKIGISRIDGLTLWRGSLSGKTVDANAELRLVNGVPSWVVEGSAIDEVNYGLTDIENFSKIKEIPEVNNRWEVPLTVEDLLGYLEELTKDNRPEFLGTDEFKENLKDLLDRMNAQWRLYREEERFSFPYIQAIELNNSVTLFLNQRKKGNQKIWAMEKSPFFFSSIVSHFVTDKDVQLQNLLTEILESQKTTPDHEKYNELSKTYLPISELLQLMGNSKEYLQKVEDKLLSKYERKSSRDKVYTYFIHRLLGTPVYVSFAYSSGELKPEIDTKYVDFFMKVYGLKFKSPADQDEEVDDTAPQAEPIPPFDSETEVSIHTATDFKKIFLYKGAGLIETQHELIKRQLGSTVQTIEKKLVDPKEKNPEKAKSVTAFLRDFGKTKPRWVIKRDDIEKFAEVFGLEVKAKKKAKKEKKLTDQEKTKKMLQDLRVLDIAETLAGSPGSTYQIISILLNQQITNKDELAQTERLLRKYIEQMNMGEGTGQAGRLVGGRKVNPFEYIRKILTYLQLQDDDKLTDREIMALVRAFIRFSFSRLVENEEETRNQLQQTIAEIPELKGTAKKTSEILNKEIDRIVNQGLKYQPAWIKTELKPHQKVGAWTMRNSQQLNNARDILGDEASDQPAQIQEDDEVFGFLLGDEPRLGKTIQTYAAIPPSWRAAIAVPRVVLETWEEQFNEHTTKQHELIVVRGPPGQKRKILKENKGKKGVILLFSIEDGRGWENSMLDDLMLGDNGEPILDVLVVDEAQAIQNYKGDDRASTPLQARMVHNIKAKQKWMLSATPFTSHPKQLFSLFHLVHRNPLTGAITNSLFESLKTFTLFLQNGWMALTWFYTFLTNIGLRRMQSEFNGLYSQRKEVRPDAKVKGSGGFPLSIQQSRLLLRIAMKLTGDGGYLDTFNRQVPVHRRKDEDSGGYFLKREFLHWAAADPSYLGEQMSSSFWEGMDEFVLPRVDKEEDAKGGIVAYNKEMVNRVANYYRNKYSKSKGRKYNVVVINGDVSGNARDKDDNEIRVRYEDDGKGGTKMVLDPDGETIHAQAYARRLFQEDPDTDIVVLGEKAGVGLRLDSAHWWYYAQVPQNYVSYHQSSMRGIGFNPYHGTGRIKEVEVGMAIPEFPENLEDHLNEEEKEYVEELKSKSGGKLLTPQQIYYASMMGPEKARFLLTMDNVPSDEDPEKIAQNRITKSMPGFLEKPVKTSASAKERRQLKNTIAYFPIVKQVLQDNVLEKAQQEKIQDDVLTLIQAYSRVNMSADELGLVINERIASGEKFDTNDLRYIKALLNYPNKPQRYQMLGMLPEMYKKIYEAGLSGFSDIAQRSPPAVQELAESNPQYFISYVSALQAWRPEALNGGLSGAALIVEGLLEEFDFEDGSDTSPWRLFTALSSLIDVSSTELFDFLSPLQSEFLDSAESIESQLQFFDRLAALNMADNERFTELIELRQSLDETKAALQKAIIDVFIYEFALDEMVENEEEKVRALEQKWGNLNAPLQLMAILKQGGKKGYNKHIFLFREMMKHIVEGDFDKWRNQQHRGEKDVAGILDYRVDDNNFWEVFTKEVDPSQDEAARFEKTVVVARAINEVQTQAKKILLNRLSNKKALEEAFGKEAAEQLMKDIKNPDVLDEIQKEQKKQGTKSNNLKKKFFKETKENQAKVAGDLDQVRDQLNLLALRKSILELRPLLDEKAVIADEQAKTAIAHLKRIEGAVKDIIRSEDSVLDIADAARHLTDNLYTTKENKTYEDVRIQITSDPLMMMNRGQMHPQLINCLHLHGAPRQVATLIDDMASRNKTLAVVSIKDEPVSVVPLKLRQRKDGQRQGKPAIHLSMPTFRGGFHFVPQIAQVIDDKKLTAMPDTEITIDWVNDDEDKKIEVQTTGGIGPTEYVQAVFAVRDQTPDLYHAAEVYYTAHEEDDAALIQSRAKNWIPLFGFIFGNSAWSHYKRWGGPINEEGFGYSLFPLLLAVVLSLLGADPVLTQLIFWSTMILSRGWFVLVHQSKGQKRDAVLVSAIGLAATVGFSLFMSVDWVWLSLSFSSFLLAHIAVNTARDRKDILRIRQQALSSAEKAAAIYQGRLSDQAAINEDLIKEILPNINLDIDAIDPTFEQTNGLSPELARQRRNEQIYRRVFAAQLIQLLNQRPLKAPSLRKAFQLINRAA